MWSPVSWVKIDFVSVELGMRMGWHDWLTTHIFPFRQGHCIPRSQHLFSSIHSENKTQTYTKSKWSFTVSIKFSSWKKSLIGRKWSGSACSEYVHFANSQPSLKCSSEDQMTSPPYLMQISRRIHYTAWEISTSRAEQGPLTLTDNLLFSIFFTHTVGSTLGTSLLTHTHTQTHT